MVSLFVALLQQKQKKMDRRLGCSAPEQTIRAFCGSQLMQECGLAAEANVLQSDTRAASKAETLEAICLRLLPSVVVKADEVNL